MKGYSFEVGAREDGQEGTLTAWQSRVADAIGTVIEGWGFKRNQGRVWTLLYLRSETLTAPEIGAELGLSKGAVSTVTRELEGWGVIHRVRVPGRRAWRFGAETDFLKMVRHVVANREARVIAHVRRELEVAQAEATAAGTDPAEVARVERLRQMATAMDAAIALFVETAHLDLTAAARWLVATAGAEPPP
jgi:DNA-binding transcriptional regulator GbsR (MarR family)